MAGEKKEGAQSSGMNPEYGRFSGEQIDHRSRGLGAGSGCSSFRRGGPLGIIFRLGNRIILEGPSFAQGGTIWSLHFRTARRNFLLIRQQLRL
jgi:hypothetical protein